MIILRKTRYYEVFIGIDTRLRQNVFHFPGNTSINMYLFSIFVCFLYLKFCIMKINIKYINSWPIASWEIELSQAILKMLPLMVKEYLLWWKIVHLLEVIWLEHVLNPAETKGRNFLLYTTTQQLLCKTKSITNL